MIAWSFALLRAATCLMLLIGAASAQEAATDSGAATNNPWAEGGYRPIPLPEVEGTIPWETLSQVELVYEGPDLVPEYGDQIQDLSGKRIKMVGFMLPLDASGERILLSQYAPHCPFCMTAGPESFVELQCEERIEMSLDPIVVEGTFEVLEQSWEGYYYRIADATVIEP